MRPQQNRRMRGRGNNNNNNGNRNRMPNPLARNYESNGPDVKIRGNAQHIADKYTTLARDAQASGDRIMAENYLQHAEHYMRIILSAQPQVVQNLQDATAYETSDNTNVVDLPLANAHEMSSEVSNEMQQGDSLQLVDSQVGAGVARAEGETIADVVVATGDGLEPDANNGTAKASSNEQRVPRRVTRRRLPRQVVTEVETVTAMPQSDRDAAAKPKRTRLIKTAVAPVDADMAETGVAPILVNSDEAVEKPRRRRRVLKNDEVVVAAS